MSLLDVARRAKGQGRLNYGRELIAHWASSVPGDHLRVLDIGCGSGDDLAAVAAAVAPRTVEMHGVELLPRAMAAAAGRGVTVTRLDIEQEALPYADGTFDVVVANQVLEHTKEVFWIVAEASRVLRPGGLFLVGVPNLASLHNRLLLGVGQQPTSIETLGPHVRGFTLPALRRLLGSGGYFAVVACAGSNFYPFPPWVARRLARIWPGGAVSIFVCAQRTERPGDFLTIVDGRMEATPFRAR